MKTILIQKLSQLVTKILFWNWLNLAGFFLNGNFGFLHVVGDFGFSNCGVVTRSRKEVFLNAEEKNVSVSFFFRRCSTDSQLGFATAIMSRLEV
jgi:hypothetical protein